MFSNGIYERVKLLADRFGKVNPVLFDKPIEIDNL
jgi:hypothetical protein